MTHPSSPPAPMTAERLTHIQANWRSAPDRAAGGAATIVNELLVHIDALTARVAELERDLATVMSDYSQIIAKQDDEIEAAEAKLESARRDALEEAASECLILERDDAVDCPSGPAWKWYGKSRDHAAARIRALQTKDTTP